MKAFISVIVVIFCWTPLHWLEASNTQSQEDYERNTIGFHKFPGYEDYLRVQYYRGILEALPKIVKSHNNKDGSFRYVVSNFLDNYREKHSQKKSLDHEKIFNDIKQEFNQLLKKVKKETKTVKLNFFMSQYERLYEKYVFVASVKGNPSAVRCLVADVYQDRHKVWIDTPPQIKLARIISVLDKIPIYWKSDPSSIPENSLAYQYNTTLYHAGFVFHELGKEHLSEEYILKARKRGDPRAIKWTF